MPNANNHILPFRLKGKNINRYLGCLALAISGLSFCFFLGFPFAKHNETYIWVSIFNQVDFFDTLTKKVINIESFRPLGMANAWLTYKLSGNIFLQEILNWLFAIASFFILFINSSNRPLFSLAAFLGCTCFFAGYIYLFHLHGVFYGPFQLYTAMLVSIACSQTALSGRMLIALAGLTIVAALYHTFALPVFCAFTGGYIILAIRNNQKKQLYLLIVLLLLALALTKLILHAKEFKPAAQLLHGFLTSYRLTEANKPLMMLALLLPAAVLFPFFKNTVAAILASSLLFVLAGTLYRFNIPVLLLWISICLFKQLFAGNWPMAALVAITAILPGASGSGSPTYTVFVIMVCVFVTADNNPLFANAPQQVNRLAWLVVPALAVIVFLLKSGINVPLVAVLAKPILAEQEKTKQMETMAEWKIKNQAFAPFGLRLSDASELPIHSTNAVNRENRPVESQIDLDFYLDHILKGTPNSARPQQLYVTFGDKVLQGKEIVFFVKGQWNGNAYIFR